MVAFKSIFVLLYTGAQYLYCNLLNLSESFEITRLTLSPKAAKNLPQTETTFVSNMCV